MNQRKLLALAAVLMLIVPLLAGLSGGRIAVAQEEAEVNADITGEIDVAMVGNPQMVTLDELIPEFNELYPNITVNTTIVPENEVRQIITKDVATQAGQFDLVTIGTFEVPLWGQQGWLEEVGEEVAADPNYDLEDIFEAHREGLSYEEGLYALPFYGESSMVFYRKDLFEEAGLEMPERPTWQEIADFARQLHDPEAGVYGICLRGLPGWGQQLAPLTTVINAFGGRWFDEDWNAALAEPESAEAIRFYIELLQEAGEPGAEQAGFTECQTLFNEGKAAIWYDATSAAELVSDPELSQVAENVGYAYAPSDNLPTGNWLWNWAFAIPTSADDKEAALAFAKWATSKDYVDLVSELRGWGEAPTGHRASIYEDPGYQEFAADFYEIVLNAIREADPNQPTEDPVPYTGGQFVRIPEFQQLGDDVSRVFADAIVGNIEIDEAIERANELANETAELGGYQE